MGVNTIHAQYQRIIVQICLVSSVDWASQAFLWGGGGTFLSCTWYLPTVLLKRFAWKKYLVCANQPAGAQNSFPSFLSSVAFPVWGAVTGKHLIPPGNCCYKTPWQDVNVTEKTFPDWNDSFWCGFREGIEDFAGFFFSGFWGSFVSKNCLILRNGQTLWFQPGVVTVIISQKIWIVLWWQQVAWRWCLLGIPEQ